MLLRRRLCYNRQGISYTNCTHMIDRTFRQNLQQFSLFIYHHLSTCGLQNGPKEYLGFINKLPTVDDGTLQA